jgi:DNA-binding Lrp family transcriptional regulator
MKRVVLPGGTGRGTAADSSSDSNTGGRLWFMASCDAIQTEVGKAAKVAKDIIDIPGVQEAQAVTGPYDVIVRAEAHNIDELGQLVVARVQAVDGITRTLTCPVVHL